MSHQQKMSIVIALLSVFYLGFGVIMNWQITHIASLVEQLQNHPLAVTRAILTASRDSIAISRNVKDMILVATQEHRRSRLAEIELYEKNIRENIDLVYDRIVGEEGKALTKHAITLLSQQKELRLHITNEVFSGKIALAADLARTEGTAIMKKIEETMDKITHYAETQSMSYHVESISELKRSKVILFSAGTIIAILSLLFTLTVEGPLLRSLRKTRERIETSSARPLDLSGRFIVPSGIKINEALNDFTKNIASQITLIKSQSAAIDKEITGLTTVEQNMPIVFNQLATKLDPILEKINAFTNGQEKNEQCFATIIALLEKTRMDFILIAEMLASEQLMMEHLLGTTHSNAVSQLKEHGRSLIANVDRSTIAISEVTNLLKSLLIGLADLRAAALLNKDVAADIENLKKQFFDYEKRLSHVKETSQKLSESLSSGFKLS